MLPRTRPGSSCVGHVSFAVSAMSNLLILDIHSAQDNAKFASSGGDKAVFVWDVASGAVTRRLQGHFGKINAVRFSQEAQVLASGKILSHTE